jgi:hypothetical protein
VTGRLPVTATAIVGPLLAFAVTAVDVLALALLQVDVPPMPDGASVVGVRCLPAQYDSCWNLLVCLIVNLNEPRGLVVTARLLD